MIAGERRSWHATRSVATHAAMYRPQTAALCSLMALLLPGCGENPRQTASTCPAGGEPARAAASHPATRAADMPGLHNLLEVAPSFWSGSGPEGQAGFASLARLGIKTIISVDGGRPELEAAHRHRMRYVHIPVGYDGIPLEKQQLLARAVRDLPGPVYLHCHHGRHRGPAAAASAAVALGRLTPAQGVSFLKRAGTADMYAGLYGCVRDLEPADAAVLDAIPADFPELARVSGFVEAMVRIDEHFEHLQLIQQAGWKPPSDHPDLVPPQVAAMLAELLKSQQPRAADYPDPQNFAGLIQHAARSAAGLSALLAAPRPDPRQLDPHVETLRLACRDCHKRYRDHKP